MSYSREQANGFSADQFKAIFRVHPAGVAIVTLADGERPIGFTATSVISVSAEPPVVAFSVAGTSSSWSALATADTVNIHFLEECHQSLAARFATPGIDRFDGVNWKRLLTGEPLLADVGTWVRCSILARHAAGSSFLVQVRPESAIVQSSHVPIVYQDRAFRRIGEGVSAC